VGDEHVGLGGLDGFQRVLQIGDVGIEGVRVASRCGTVGSGRARVGTVVRADSGRAGDGGKDGLFAVAEVPLACAELVVRVVGTGSFVSRT
jgi:hypothetical protein